MNRKGDLFMLGLNILFLIALIMIFWKLGNEFRPQNEHEGIGTRQTAMLNTLALSERMLLFIDTAATYAAYEALDTLADKGAVNPLGNECGSYAGYERWTLPDGTCLSTREELDADFAKELDRVLKRLWTLPGLPAGITYGYEVERTSAGIRVHGLTDDEIVLPIITAKDRTQESIRGLILGENIAGVRKGLFRKDTRLPASVRPSPNRQDRSSAVSGVLVLATGTDHVTDAYRLYEQTEASVHYVIDTDGSVTQLVPERERANPCETCDDDRLISIGLVNALSHGGACHDDDIILNNECWEPYPQEQLDALVNLAGDIVRRNGLSAEDAVLSGEDPPGPAFMDMASFLTRVAKAAASDVPTVEAPPAKDMTALLTMWPTDTRTVSSCYGDRSGDFHDGIDMGGVDRPVYAFADGIVADACEGYCGGFGNNVLLRHDNGWHSRYSHLSSISVEDGERVARGDLLGRTGNTGKSRGAHLDFKVYTGEVGKDTGQNPLCFFSDGTLASLDFTGRNCAYDRPLAQSDPQLQRECSGLPRQTLEDAGGCFFPMPEADGSPQVTATLENLEVKDEISAGAQEANVDPSLVIAIIAQETCLTLDHCGTPDLVSPTGCAGLGQFCKSTAQGEPFSSIFGPGIRSCDCPGTGRACTAEQAGCRGDPRFNAVKSAHAIAALLRENLDQFADMQDQTRFAIASYNGGAVVVKMAIEKTGKEDPLWEEVAAALDGTLIERVCDEKGGLCFFDSSALRQGKAEEIITYVDRVSGYYASLGGDVGADQVCGPSRVPVKHLGTYTFEPDFRVTVTDVLEPMERLMAWAEETYEACDGSGDNRDCLRRRQQASLPGVRFEGCAAVEGDAHIATWYRQFREDCASNGQSGCACEFYPIPNKDADIRLYGEVARPYVDGEPVGVAPDGSPISLLDGEEALLSLRISDGQKRYVTWERPDTAEGTESPFLEEAGMTDTDVFRLRKDDMSWTTEDMRACGIYKEQHHVCARITTPTYSLSSGETKEPLVKFALYLEDRVPPEPVVDAKAYDLSGQGLLFSLGGLTDLLGIGDLLSDIREELGGIAGTPVLLLFDPSPSDDVSYYEVECSDDVKILLGRSVNPDGFDTKITDGFREVLSCTRKEVTVTPYDIGGNAGESVSVEAETPTVPVG